MMTSSSFWGDTCSRSWLVPHELLLWHTLFGESSRPRGLLFTAAAVLGWRRWRAVVVLHDKIASTSTTTNSRLQSWLPYLLLLLLPHGISYLMGPRTIRIVRVHGSRCSSTKLRHHHCSPCHLEQAAVSKHPLYMVASNSLAHKVWDWLRVQLCVYVYTWRAHSQKFHLPFTQQYSTRCDAAATWQCFGSQTRLSLLETSKL